MEQQRSNNNKRLPTPKQKKFAQVFVKTGNKTRAYKEAYEAENMKPQTINNEALVASTNPVVLKEIDKILAENDLTDEVVVKEHLKVITQDEQLTPKMQGISKYYDIKGYTRDTDRGGDINIAFIVNEHKD